MTRTLLPSLGLLLLSGVSSAQITLVAEETFVYPVPGIFHAMQGGTGWQVPWFVTGAGNADLVMFDNTIMPSFPLSDGVGGHAGQAVPFGEGYLRLDVSNAPQIVDPATNMYGADGSTVWVSFSTVNYQGQPMEHFGGLSLWKQNVGEALFLGSPWNSNGWGIDDEGGNGAPEEVIPGTDDTIPARLVTRIDFMPGNERIRMWVDPVVPHPTGPADLDSTIVDLRFDEIRIASGGNNGDSYFFDNILIEEGQPGGTQGMNYCGSNNNSTGVRATISAMGSTVAATNALSLHADDLPLNSFGFFLTSATQAFTMNPGGSQGNLCLGGAIGRYVGPGQVQNAGASGSISLALDLTQTPTPTGFISVLSGSTRNYQAWYRDAMGGVATSNFTDGVEIIFQ